MTGWNWKAATLSSILRGSLFFVTSVWAGFDKAVLATLAEVLFRGVTAGFYGGIIQSVRDVRPAWIASAVAFVLIPAISHTLEYLVHRAAGTPFLLISITASICLTVISSSFHLFAMRRGTFLTGRDASSLLEDLRQLPRLLVSWGTAPRNPRNPRLSPPKTLHITNFYHSASGGVGTFYRALIEAGNRNGRAVRLVVPGDSTRVEDIGDYGRIYHVRAPRAPFLDRRYRMLLPHTYACPYESELRRILRHEQPDLIEVCDKYALSWLPSVLRRNWIPGAGRPVLVGMSAERMDDSMRAFVGAGNAGKAFARWYMRHVYVPRFDWHIANSDYTADELLSAGPSRFHERVFVCPMGADVDVFAAARPTPIIRRYLESGFRGTPRLKLLVYGGRLSPEKNLALLFDTLEALPDTEDTQFRLIIAGSGPLETKLVNEAQSRLPGRVAFLGHIHNRKDLANLYANCDAFVHPNPREPFGIGLLEAMASSLPMVAPARGGVLSYLDGGNAWLAEPEARCFASAIQDLVADPHLRLRRSAQARQTADEHRWDVVAPRLFALYDRFVFQDSGRKDDTTERTFHMERASGCTPV